MSEWAKYFDALAEKESKEVCASARYSGVGTPAIRAIQVDVSRKLQLDKSDRLLDLGCGTGLIGQRLCREVGTLVGVDIGLEVLRRARRNLAASPRPVGFVQADVTALPFREGAFDKVLSYSLVHYLPSYETFKSGLGEMVRVVRKDGRVLVGDIPDKEKKDAWVNGHRRDGESSLRYAARRVWEHAIQSRYRFNSKKDARRMERLGIEPPHTSGVNLDRLAVLTALKELGGSGHILDQPRGLPFNRTRVDLLVDK